MKYQKEHLEQSTPRVSGGDPVFDAVQFFKDLYSPRKRG